MEKNRSKLEEIIGQLVLKTDAVQGASVGVTVSIGKLVVINNQAPKRRRPRCNDCSREKIISD